MKKTMTSMALSAVLAIPMAMTAGSANASWNGFWKVVGDSKCWSSTKKVDYYIRENCTWDAVKRR